MCLLHCFFLFFFNDTATTEIYTLSLHDALPICVDPDGVKKTPELQIQKAYKLLKKQKQIMLAYWLAEKESYLWVVDRKSTRLNSSHLVISYAVFCLKKKKKTQIKNK